MTENERRLVSKRLWPVLGTVAAVLGVIVVFGHVWRSGPTEFLPSPDMHPTVAMLIHGEQSFLVWQTQRNARALLTRPWAFFDTGHCHPTPDALAHTGPLFSMGVLAILPTLLGANPVLTFNLVLVGMALLSVWAMYWVVREWTGQPVAGLIAGILYAFHPVLMRNVVHPHIQDTTWILIGLVFATRWLARGRWSDAIGLAISLVLQLGASFYSLLGAGLVCLPFAGWSATQIKQPRRSALQLGVVVGMVLAASAFLFLPYLGASERGELREISQAFFAPFPLYAPGEKLFFGWLCLGFALIGLLAPARFLPRPREVVRAPRALWALGVLLVVLVAAGPMLPNAPSVDLWAALARLVPGMDRVRTPISVVIGAHLGLCILAGYGAAALIRMLQQPCMRRHRHGILVAFVCCVWLATLRPPALGFEPRHATGTLRIVPDESVRTFHAELASLDGDGPIFEMPLPREDGQVVWGATVPWLFDAYVHGRRTSACFGSRVFDRSALAAAERALPDPDAIRALASMGFTTIIVHHEELDGRRVRRPRRAVEAKRRLKDLRRAAARPGAGLAEIHTSKSLTAFRILESSGGSDMGAQPATNPEDRSDSR